ncbi:MAG: peptidoglycan-binding protein [Patescibacteria group bacterium]
MVRFTSLVSAVFLVCAPFFAAAQTLPFVESPTTTARNYLDQLINSLTSPSSALPLDPLAPIPTQSTQAVDILEALLAKPLPVFYYGTSTATTTDQALIQVLLEQVAALQAQINAIIAAGAGATSTAATSTPPVAEAPGAAVACPVIERTLFFGMSGDDVLNLQLFLIAEGFLEAGNATGFFGVLTQAAVQAWQAAHDIVSSGSPEETGWGVVGPRTRAALENCTA